MIDNSSTKSERRVNTLRNYNQMIYHNKAYQSNGKWYFYIYRIVNELEINEFELFGKKPEDISLCF